MFWNFFETGFTLWTKLPWNLRPWSHLSLLTQQVKTLQLLAALVTKWPKFTEGQQNPRHVASSEVPRAYCHSTVYLWQLSVNKPQAPWSTPPAGSTMQETGREGTLGGTCAVSGFALQDIPPPCFSHPPPCITERCHLRMQDIEPTTKAWLKQTPWGRQADRLELSDSPVYISSPRPTSAQSETLPKNKCKLWGCFTSKNDDQITLLFKNSSLHILWYSNGP